MASGRPVSDAGGQGAGPPTTAIGGGQVKERVLKMSSLLDQADDSELTPVTRDQVDAWLTAYVSVMGTCRRRRRSQVKGN